MAARSGSGLRLPGALGHPGRSGGSAGMGNLPWVGATGLCGGFGRLTLCRPRTPPPAPVLPAGGDISGKPAIPAARGGGNAASRALVDWGAGGNVPAYYDLGEETCRVAAAAGFPG